MNPMNASEPREDAVAEWRKSLEWVAASQTTDEYPRSATIDPQAAREIIAALAQQGAEPVAWVQFEDGKPVALSFTHNEAAGCVTPLYAGAPR